MSSRTEPYYFFLSYASESAGPELTKFFDDLVEEVSTLVPYAKERTGFIDAKQRRGQDWDDEILAALSTTKVLVCLYTPIFFSKEYCGKEVEVMRRRRRAYRATHPVTRPSNIIPVLWDPCEPPAAPRRHVARTLPHLFAGRNAKSTYETHGLRYLLKLGNRHSECVELIRQIAIDVMNAGEKFKLPEEREVRSMAAVRNAFVPQPVRLPLQDLAATTFGPDSALCFYVGPSGWERHAAGPFSPPIQDGASYVCAAVAESVEAEAREVAVNLPSEALDVLDHVARERGRVIVIIDSRALEAPEFSDWLDRYDERKYANCAVIVVGNARHDVAVQKLPRSAARPPLFHTEVQSADALGLAVEQSLQRLYTVIPAMSESSTPLERATAHASLPAL